jgi:hypothetical protein
MLAGQNQRFQSPRHKGGSDLIGVEIGGIE